MNAVTKPTITLTEAAAQHMSDCLCKRALRAIGVRILVRPSGCTGSKYEITYADTAAPEDIEFVSHGMCVFTDAKSLVSLDGLVIDYVKEGLQSGLKFNNPNVKDACGCGESFNT